jgi:hypothetical protein
VDNHVVADLAIIADGDVLHDVDVAAQFDVLPQPGALMNELIQLKLLLTRLNYFAISILYAFCVL